MSHPNDRIAAEPPDPDGHVADLVDDYLHELRAAPRRRPRPRSSSFKIPSAK